MASLEDNLHVDVDKAKKLADLVHLLATLGAEDVDYPSVNAVQIMACAGATQSWKGAGDVTVWPHVLLQVSLRYTGV